MFSPVIPAKAGIHLLPDSPAPHRTGINIKSPWRQRIRSSYIGRPVEREVRTMSFQRSFQSALVRSTNSSFHRRDHFLIAFSRLMASIMLACCSNQTRVLMRYRPVKPSAQPSRCCQIRRTRYEVTPTYKVPRGALARRYTAGAFIRVNLQPMTMAFRSRRVGATLIFVILEGVNMDSRFRGNDGLSSDMVTSVVILAERRGSIYCRVPSYRIVSSVDMDSRFRGNDGDCMVPLFARRSGLILAASFYQKRTHV